MHPLFEQLTAAMRPPISEKKSEIIQLMRLAHLRGLRIDKNGQFHGLFRLAEDFDNALKILLLKPEFIDLQECIEESGIEKV